MTSSTGYPRLLVIAAALVAAIVLIIVISRLTSPRPAATITTGRDECAVAREALDAFKADRRLPPEWIQDREATEKAVRDCRDAAPR